MNTNPIDVPKFIADIRASTNLSTKEIANRLRTSDVTLLRWEKREFAPRRKALNRLLRIHGRLVAPPSQGVGLHEQQRSAANEARLSGAALAEPAEITLPVPTGEMPIVGGDIAEGSRLIGLVVPHVTCTECGATRPVEYHLAGGEFGKLVSWRAPRGWLQLGLPDRRVFMLCEIDAGRVLGALPKAAALVVP